MAIWSYWVHNFVYITSPSLYCRPHNGYCNLTCVKIDYRHTTSVTGLLDELGWLFKCCKHSRLTALHNLSAISLDHLSVSSWHTRASSEKKFMSLPVRTDVFKHSFFPRTITHWNSSHWLFVSCSQFNPSMGSAELGILQPLLIIMTLRR